MIRVRIPAKNSLKNIFQNVLNGQEVLITTCGILRRCFEWIQSFIEGRNMLVWQKRIEMLFQNWGECSRMLKSISCPAASCKHVLQRGENKAESGPFCREICDCQQCNENCDDNKLLNVRHWKFFKMPPKAKQLTQKEAAALREKEEERRKAEPTSAAAELFWLVISVSTTTLASYPHFSFLLTPALLGCQHSRPSKFQGFKGRLP